MIRLTKSCTIPVGWGWKGQFGIATTLWESVHAGKYSMGSGFYVGIGPFILMLRNNNKFLERSQKRLNDVSVQNRQQRLRRNGVEDTVTVQWEWDD